jgi:hypothetical protein
MESFAPIVPLVVPQFTPIGYTAVAVQYQLLTLYNNEANRIRNCVILP